MKNILSFIFAALCFFPLSAFSDDTIQIPVKSILTTRSVTTLTGGKLFTWKMGIDGGGSGNGYLTMAASLFKGDINPKALPNNGVFPANTRHPHVVLNYNNDDSSTNQTKSLLGSSQMTVPIPPAIYKNVHLFFTSSEGASTLKFFLNYGDIIDSQTISLPDYFNVIATSIPNMYNLALDLAKWNKQNVMSEPSHHYIDGVILTPRTDKNLQSIRIAKATAGTYVVFWGATGILPSGQTNTDPYGKSADVLDGIRVLTGKNSISLFNLQAPTEVALYSMQGKVIQTATFNTHGNVTWNLQNGKSNASLKNGIYMTSIKSPNGTRNVPVYFKE